MAKELNPSPKIPDGEYPELSPNPKFENGLVDKTNEKPNGSEQTNPQEKPIVFNGVVHVNGKLYINGEEVESGGGDVPDEKGFDVLELSDTSGTLTDAQYTLALSNQCVIKVGTQYYYKDIDSQYYLVYKAATRVGANDTYVENITITKADKTWSYNAETVEVNSVKYSTTTPTADNTDGLKVVVLDSEPATKYNGYLYIITGE